MPDDTILMRVKETLKLNPEIREDLTRQYGTDEDLILRAFYKEMMIDRIGKR